MPTPEQTSCPQCDMVGLRLDVHLSARKLGTFALAGQQMKVSATGRVVWVCDNCGAVGPAEVSEPEEESAHGPT